MARRLLYVAVSMVFGGCIIPTQLTQAEQTPNFPPVFVTALVEPSFGQIPPLQTDTPIELKIVADDANPDDKLSVRLYKQGATSTARNYTQINIPMLGSANDSLHPTYRLGRIEQFQICAVLGNSGKTIDIFAIVADRDFSITVPNTAPGGLLDENHWELTCP